MCVCVHVCVCGALRWDSLVPYMEGGQPAQTSASASTLTIAGDVIPLKMQAFGHRAHACSITISTTSVPSSTAAQHRLAAWWRSQPPDEALAGSTQEADTVISSSTVQCSGMARTPAKGSRLVVGPGNQTYIIMIVLVFARARAISMIIDRCLPDNTKSLLLSSPRPRRPLLPCNPLIPPKEKHPPHSKG